MAQKLRQDCATAQDQLAASSQEQSLLLSKLESDVYTLYDELYHGGGRIQLSNQVSRYLLTKIITLIRHVLLLRTTWYEGCRRTNWLPHVNNEFIGIMMMSVVLCS